MRNVAVGFDFDAEIIPRPTGFVGDGYANAIVPVVTDGVETRAVQRDGTGNGIAFLDVSKILNNNAANGFNFDLSVVGRDSPAADA